MSYKISFSVANDTINLMSTVNTNINTALDELEQFCGNQLSEWTGDAQTQYEAAKTEWNAAALAMGTALTNGQKALTNITDGYVSAEGRAAGTWGG